ncbi:hypothetical protein, partial [Tepidimonas sp.]|uniref:MCP four helix bundle domain-containing protein n=1 Tax=Tepidimonas sp. TaxID=2002775 RepID=UPI0028CBF5BC
MSVRDWKIGIRLGAGFGVVLALLVAVWAAAQWSQRITLTQTERAMFAAKVALSAEKWAAITRTQLNRTEAAIRFGDNPEILNYFQQQIQATRAQVDEIEKTLSAQVKELDDAEVSQQLERVATLRQAQIAARDEALAAVKAGDMDRAKALLESRYKAGAQAYIDAQQRLTDTLMALADRLNAQAQVIAQRAQWMMLGVVLAALAVGVGVAVSLTRGITRPLAEAIDVAQAIAQGDLARRIHVD